jgi:DedD protein
MGLLSIFQRNKQASATSGKGRGGRSAARQAPLASNPNPADAAEALREVRARARTRLMGATVLLLIGVIGFPLLFETQPRPIPVDLPIEIPARNAPAVVDAGAHAARPSLAGTGAAPLSASGPAPESVSYDARPALPSAASAPASEPVAPRSAFGSLAAALTPAAAHTDAPASAAYVAPSMGGSGPTAALARTPAKPVKPAASTATASVAAASKPAPATHAAGPVLPPPVVASKPSPAAILADTASARPSDAAAGGGRFVVQVGAFLDDAKVRDTRAKVEKLGMKTYTQPVDTPTGKRIRVRVGPYTTKAEADKSAARLKSDGLQAVVLAL